MITHDPYAGESLVRALSGDPMGAVAVLAFRAAILERPEIVAKKCERLNEFEKELAKLPAPPTPPLVHRFTPGLYSREIFLQKDLVCTSKIHKTEHQFIVIGVFEMWSEETGWVFIDASKKPFHGITRPGTRRAFRIHEDTWFTTFHPTTLTDLKEIEAALIEPHEIPKQCPSLPSEQS